MLRRPSLQTMLVPTLVLTCSILLGCGASGPPATALADDTPVTSIGQSIMGGTDDHADLPVVGIFIEMGYSAGMCSGSLIAPNLVLTARHCVAETGETVQCGKSKFGSTFSASSFHVTTEWDGLRQAAYTYQFNGNWFQVANVWVSDTDDVCGNDVALLELQGGGVPASITSPISPRLNSRMAPGEAYRAVGYGAIDDNGQGAGKKRQLTGLAAHCVGNCNPFYLENQQEWEGDHGICQGDSGGPALDTAGRVVGVVSRGGAGCTTPIYADLPAWADWIRAHAKQAAMDGSYPTPDWVTDMGGQGGSAGQSGAGGHAGSAGEAGAGQGGSSPSLGGPGAPCETEDQCQESLVCVYENSLTRYCAPTCSAASPTCPDGMTCDKAIGACFLPGGFGSACEGGADCRSGLCVRDASGQYCSQVCSQQNNSCPEPAKCDEKKALCFLPEKAQPNEPEPVSSSGACSLSPGRTSSHQQAPWNLLLALGAAFALVRRRSLRHQA